MGQRSQIYIRIRDKDNNVTLIAKYFQWNFGERMISRARHGIEHIKLNLEYLHFDNIREKINKIFEVNFDMKDIVFSQDILEEVREGLWCDRDSTNDYIFTQQDNNDGKLFIDCDQNSGEIKFCFTDYNLNILSPKQYMDWDYENWEKSEYLDKEDVEICKNNIEYLNENAKMMTNNELENFMNYDYSKQIGDSNFIKLLQDFNEKGIVHDKYFYYVIERIDDKGSWKFYKENSNELCMQYDDNTKTIIVENSFKECHEGLVQDAYKFYNLSYGIQIDEVNKPNENDVDYDY